jgi:lambda family phage portal protein
VLDGLRQTIRQWFTPRTATAVPARRQQRMYAMARPSRLTSGWGTQTTSEDTELSSSLRTARNRSRELCRDAGYAKRAKVIIQNNVIGTGIGLQAKVETSRGALNERINDEIENVFEEWCKPDHCHTGQSLHFNAMERMLSGETFEAGEILVRLHRSRFGNSRVPLALEVIEPERLADEFQPSPVEAKARVRLGVEVDRFGAPLAYWIRSLHPGELRLTAEQTDRIERVPSADIIHLRIIDRWPQTRSMPWMHATARKFNDMDGLTEAEITAARAAACYMGFIESPDGETQMGDEQPDGSKEVELSPAIIEHLAPGEKFNYAAPNRPNAQLDPFMRMMLREVAAGTGPSYESLSRDYSQSNYSSSRLALLDDRDLWRVLQMWFIRDFRSRVHAVWLQQAVLARVITSIPLEQYALNPIKFEAVRFKPRGWGWIDPTKEVQAYEQAIRNGFTTVGRVIAQTADGSDLEDILKERKQELEMMQRLGLKFDTDPSTVKDPNAQAPPAPPAPIDAAGDDPAVQNAEKMLRSHRAKMEDMSDVL